ncbi:MAG: hypothetical protein QG579_175 [Patescibacteria group bacterium]|nr:hypothetical protein [Patescibacteria group bacterium]
MVYELIVNYALSLADMVKAGAYDWFSSDVNEGNFPKMGEGEVPVSAELIHFNKYTSSEGAVTEMGGLGFRPATIHELLAFGQKYPNVQREFPIIALGSSCEIVSVCLVAYLDKEGSKRLLRLHWSGDSWDDDCRFLAVRK